MTFEKIAAESSSRMIAAALRSTMYSGEETLRFTKIFDESDDVSHLFLPDIPQGFESLEMSSAALAVSKRIKVGTGVIRPLEHSALGLARRIGTIQYMSDNRFFLGIGTGDPGPSPKDTLNRMFEMLDETREAFLSRFKEGISMPPVFVGALRIGIARKALDHAEGIILNFCSAEYARGLVAKLNLERRRDSKTIASYIKIFYSKDDGTARKLMIGEFSFYDRIKSYHSMFSLQGVAEDLAAKKNKAGDIPKSLFDISLANPSRNELQEFVNKFREAGVDLPCVYPYFAPNEETSFKEKIIRDISLIH